MAAETIESNISWDQDETTLRYTPVSLQDRFSTQNAPVVKSNGFLHVLRVLGNTPMLLEEIAEAAGIDVGLAAEQIASMLSADVPGLAEVEFDDMIGWCFLEPFSEVQASSPTVYVKRGSEV